MGLPQTSRQCGGRAKLGVRRRFDLLEWGEWAGTGRGEVLNDGEDKMRSSLKRKPSKSLLQVHQRE